MTSDAGARAELGPSFPDLFRPGRIGSLHLGNRVRMAPMEKNLCTADGVIASRYIDYLLERARFDVALLRVEATYVDPVGKGRPFQAGAHNDKIIPALSGLVSAPGAGALRPADQLHRHRPVTGCAERGAVCRQRRVHATTADSG